MSKRALILTGGDYCPSRLTETDMQADIVIAADCGIGKAKALGITPDFCIGDFDSTSVPTDFVTSTVEIAPAEKDETDTMLAVERAISLGAGQITIVGGTGGRIDHTLSNILMLEGLRLRGIDAVLTDGCNRVRVAVDESVTLCKSSFKYFGVVALTECTVSIDGAKYPLTNKPLCRHIPYAVSNEIVGEEATVTVKGTAIITES